MYDERCTPFSRDSDAMTEVDREYVIILEIGKRRRYQEHKGASGMLQVIFSTLCSDLLLLASPKLPRHIELPKKSHEF